MCSLGRLHRRRNLGVRGSEQAGDLFGQPLIGGKAGELALPEVEITPGQAVEIGRIVVFGGHARTIADRGPSWSLGRCFRTRKPLLVALRYRR